LWSFVVNRFGGLLRNSENKKPQGFLFRYPHLFFQAYNLFLLLFYEALLRRRPGDSRPTRMPGCARRAAPWMVLALLLSAFGGEMEFVCDKLQCFNPPRMAD
jgi:hypothetical protein